MSIHAAAASSPSFWSAAGIATLSEIIERDLCANVRRAGERLRAGLESLSKHGIVGDLRGKGLLQCVEFVRDPETKQQWDPPLGQLIGRRALENGLITRFDPHWIALGPPLTVSDDQVDEIIETLDRSISEVLAEQGSA